MGSKARFANELLPIILKDRKPNQYYVELFCGGCNTIDKVSGNRIANDNNFYLIELLKKIASGWIPDKITKDQYYQIKNNKADFDPALVGWVGFNCSYSGKWFGGFAGETKTKINTIRDYQQEAINNIIKQSEGLKGIIYQNKNYFDVYIPEDSIVYLDPPYENTTSYSGEFNHQLFWQFVRNISEKHSVFISEYNAPPDFQCIWQKDAKSSLSANGKIGGNKLSTEKLFIYVGNS